MRGRRISPTSTADNSHFGGGRVPRNISPIRLCPHAVPPILVAVWVYMPVWEVQTGEVEQLAVGDVVERLGVRATFWSLEPTTEAEGVVELPGPSPSGDGATHHRVVGTVRWVREPHSLVVVVGSFALLAEPQPVGAGIGGLGSWPSPEPAFPEVGLPALGERVALVATLGSMLSYEPDAYDYPDVERDWVVRGLRVEHRELVPSSAYPGGREPGRILRVTEIPRMLRWADAPRHGHSTYLVDLVPTR